MFTFLTQSDRGSPYQVRTSNGWKTQKLKHLTKTWENDPTQNQTQFASKFDIKEQVEPLNLKEVANLLTKYAKDTDTIMLLDSMPDTATQTQNLPRQARIFSETRLTKFIVFDIDSFEKPEYLEPLDIAGQARYVLELLEERFPKYFDSDMAFVAKASASSAIKSGIRLHLYVENSVPVNVKQVETIAVEVNQVFQDEFGTDLFDESLYKSVHPIFTADPRFIGTVEDPFSHASRIQSKLKGTTCAIPPNTAEKSRVKTAELTDEDLENIKRYQGEEFLTNRVEAVLEKIREEGDNVYQKHVHRLIFLGLEDGISIEALRHGFEQAMEDHPKITGGERDIGSYFNGAVKHVLSVTKDRAIRSIPKTLNAELKPRFEIPIDERKECVFDFPVNLLPEDDTRVTLPDGRVFLKLPGMPKRGELTYVKASLGTGKTRGVVDLVVGNEETGLKPLFKHGRFLTITNTRALVDGNARLFNAPTNTAYLSRAERDNFKNSRNGRMSTTIHSIHYFEEMANEGLIDFIFIDECDAVMDTLVNATSNVMRERTKCYETLGTLLEKAKYVILADGDIGEETLFAYNALCPKPITAINLKVNKLHGSLAYEVPTQEALWAHGVHAALHDNCKVLIVSDLGPDPINARVKALELLHPDKIIKPIHKDSTKDKDIKEILEYTDDALRKQQIDCLICSPSIVGGIDFSYFDNVCLLTVTKTSTPNLRFQALRRCRKPNKEFWLHTDRDVSNFSTGVRMINSKYNKDDIDYIRQKFALRKEKEYAHFASNLRFMLLDQGCKVIVDHEPTQTLEAIVKSQTNLSAKEIAREEKIDAILSSTEDYVPPRYNDAYNTKKQIAHYYEIEGVDKVTYEDVDRYIDQDIHKRMDNLTHIVREDLWNNLYYTVKDLEGFHRYLKINGMVWHIATGENVYTGTGKHAIYRNTKYQAYRIGLELHKREDKIEPNWQQIKEWFRKYCEYMEIKIPREFLTPEEIKKAAETSEDLSLRSNLVPEISANQGAKAWADVIS